jgi:hypothetical protein
MGVAPRPSSASTIGVGDPWRSALRRPVFATLGAAAAFFAETAPLKETPLLFDHAPWLNDPFDTVISFMIFFVPLIALLCLPRVLLCRRFEPLPSARIRDVLRGCRVVLAGISLTLAAEWISVLIGDNRAQWNWATLLQIALLAMTSAVDLVLIVALRRVGLPTVDAGPDCLSDLLTFLARYARRLGPIPRPLQRVLSLGERRLGAVVRRHPILTALGASAVFGAGVGINQAVREGYRTSVTLVVSSLLTSGMFGLLSLAGAYLGLVRSSSPWHGAGRRLIDAAVIASTGILVPFALRYHLWWLMGTTNQAAGLTQLLALCAISGAAIFATTYAVESLLRMHSSPARRT